ncbi:MAG: hypothetical protein WCX28_13625, partial [Bacteriovoracaceae bacterium]
MKQTLKFSILLALMVLTVAFAEKKKEKDEIQPITIGKAAVSSDQATAASSPWLPLNLETATSQFKVAEFFKNGTVLIAGGRTTAPMLGNYYGFYSKDSAKSFKKFSFPNFQSSAGSTSLRFVGLASWGDSVIINADYAGYLIRTTNWGATWDTVSTAYAPAPDAFYDGVKFISHDTVIAYGDVADSAIFINRSTDRGATWNRVVISAKLSPDFGSYLFAAAGSKSIASFGNNIWMNCYIGSGANVPGILKSTDAGLTWSFIQPANFSAKRKYTFNNFSFKDANVGYGLVNNSYVYSIHKTTDGGTTWGDSISVGGPTADVLTQQPFQIQALPGTSIVYVSGYDGKNPASWKSTDDGATWTKLVTPPNTGTQALLGQISFISENIGVAAGVRQALKFTPSVELTFRVNTSTIPDTLKATSTVQMRGDGGASGGLLDWNGASSVRFTNVGGDYWQAKARFVPGADFPYKIFTNVVPNVGPGHAQEHNGWEKDITTHGNGNRRMVVGENDTTIMLQFANGSTANQEQFWRPYTETDSIEVTFRVNMANQEDFNVATQKVGVNGSINGWGSPTFFLTQEQNDGNNPTRYPGGNFWSGTFKLPITKAQVDTLSAPIEYAYKFVQKDANTKWESVPDRKFQIKKGSSDTTLYWKWWDDVGAKPPAGIDTAIVAFRVDMTRAIQTNGYNVGDTVQVRYGFANSAKVVGTKNLVKQGLTFVYTGVDSNVVNVNIKADGTGKPLVYQYYLVKNGQDYREVYYNFNYTGSDVTLAERRLLAVTGKSNTALDTSKNMTNASRWPFWRNTRKLKTN